MTDIAANINAIRDQIGPGIKLVAVSKTKPVRDILEAYDAGQRLFGENRVQELLNKKDHVPWDVEWHLIGHLQTNKVRFVVPFVSMIQSVDSVKLLTAVNNEALKINRIVNCLLQIHIATEETKYGFSMDELTEAASTELFDQLTQVRICGVMGMATFTDDQQVVRAEFRYLKQCFESLRETFFQTNLHFREISMGMSGDYRIAAEEGSTMVRIGSMVFGERTKQKE